MLRLFTVCGTPVPGWVDKHWYVRYSMSPQLKSAHHLLLNPSSCRHCLPVAGLLAAKSRKLRHGRVSLLSHRELIVAGRAGMLHMKFGVFTK
jgi:hypothetical protein